MTEDDNEYTIDGFIDGSERLLLHLVPESLGDDCVGQLDVGGHARRLARRQSHGLDLGKQEARI